eukprot:14670268-Alexandrium_andersonii.AAC.1
MPMLLQRETFPSDFMTTASAAVGNVPKHFGVSAQATSTFDPGSTADIRTTPRAAVLVGTDVYDTG